MVMMVTVALMVGEMWARWLSESGYNLDVSQSRGPGFENPFGGFRMLGKFVYHTLPKVSQDASSMSEKDRSRSLNQRRKEAL